MNILLSASDLIPLDPSREWSRVLGRGIDADVTVRVVAPPGMHLVLYDNWRFAGAGHAKFRQPIPQFGEFTLMMGDVPLLVIQYADYDVYRRIPGPSFRASFFQFVVKGIPINLHATFDVVPIDHEFSEVEDAPHIVGAA